MIGKLLIGISCWGELKLWPRESLWLHSRTCLVYDCMSVTHAVIVLCSHKRRAPTSPKYLLGWGPHHFPGQLALILELRCWRDVCLPVGAPQLPAPRCQGWPQDTAARGYPWYTPYPGDSTAMRAQAAPMGDDAVAVVSPRCCPRLGQLKAVFVLQQLRLYRGLKKQY